MQSPQVGPNSPNGATSASLSQSSPLSSPPPLTAVTEQGSTTDNVPHHPPSLSSTPPLPLSPLLSSTSTPLPANGQGPTTDNVPLPTSPPLLSTTCTPSGATAIVQASAADNVALPPSLSTTTTTTSSTMPARSSPSTTAEPTEDGAPQQRQQWRGGSGRKNWCYRCETMQTKLMRHMIAKHAQSPEVQQYLLVTDPDPIVQRNKRKELCRTIVNRSNHLYNEKIVSGEVLGNVLPIKWSRKNEVSAVSHVVCPKCKGLVTKKYFGSHARVCKTKHCHRYRREHGKGGGRVGSGGRGSRREEDAEVEEEEEDDDGVDEENEEKNNDDDDNNVNDDSGVVVTERHRRRTSRKTKASFLLPPLEPKFKQLETYIFPKMTKDQISYTAQTDRLILQYGRRFFQTHKSVHQRYYVSSQMRTLADLLIRFRNVDPAHVKTLADCLDPTNFDNLCKVVRGWSGFNDTSGLCSRGSVPRRLCKSLKVCSKIMWFEAIKDKHLTIEQQLNVRNKHERFTALMESDWAMEVNSAADKSLKIQKMNKQDKMPLYEDIEKFFRTMSERIKHATYKLLNDNDDDDDDDDNNDGGGKCGLYAELTKACIVYLIVFNCRRPSEVVYATLNNYTSTLKTRATTAKNQNDNDTAAEASAAAVDTRDDSMAVFTVAALKNDVKVPIILTPVVQSAVNALLSYRARLHVKGDLLFGKVDDGTAYNGGALLNRYKAEMDLKRPDDFSANGFRHYLATVSQTMNPEIKRHMPKFLGHTLATHQRFYEMPMSDIHLDIIGPSLSRLLCRRRRRCQISDKLQTMSLAAEDENTSTTTATATANNDDSSSNSTFSFTLHYDGDGDDDDNEDDFDNPGSVYQSSKDNTTAATAAVTVTAKEDVCTGIVPLDVYKHRRYVNPDNVVSAGSSRETATDFCPGNPIYDKTVMYSSNCGGRKEDGDNGNVHDVGETATRLSPPSSSSPPPPKSTSSVSTGLRPLLRCQPKRSVKAAEVTAVDTDSDKDNCHEDPDFVIATTRDTVRATDTSSGSNTDSDLFASPLRVVRTKNRWTTPERKELYNSLPRTILGLRRAERGEIRSVWEKSKLIRKRHSLQTTRIEVSKHFTRKKKVATPTRQSLLESINVPSSE